jgi:hypothetical protein
MATVAIGDTIGGESLDPLGDVDLFTFDGRRGDDVDIQFEGLDTLSARNMWLQLMNARDPIIPMAVAYAAPGSDHSFTTHHLVLPDSGAYILRVGPVNEGTSTAERGPYRLIVHRTLRGTEHHTAMIAMGDTVADERLDDIDDVDEFTVTGAPKQDAIVFLTADSGTAGAYLEVVDPVTRDSIRAIWSSGGGAVNSDRFQLTSNGTAAVRVFRPKLGLLESIRAPVGGYAFTVVPIDRSPEQVSGAIAIGDTITAESIDPIGDIDEFTFPGTAGDRLEVFFTPDSAPPMTIEVFRPGTSEPLAALTTLRTTPNLGDQSTDAFTLPATGSYLLRVSGGTGALKGLGGYRFTVSHAP